MQPSCRASGREPFCVRNTIPLSKVIIKSACSVLFLNLYLLKYIYNLTYSRNLRSFILVLLKGLGIFILILFLTNICLLRLITKGIRVSILDNISYNLEIITYSNQYYSSIVLKV